MDTYIATQKSLEKKLSTAKATINAMKHQQAEKKLAKDARKKKKAEKKKEQKKIEKSGQEYNKVPFFKFVAGSKIVPNLSSEAACQSICDRQVKCKSFSWDSNAKKCIWSVDSITFDPEFSISFKAQVSTDGMPQQKWRHFPGLRCQRRPLFEIDRFA